MRTKLKYSLAAFIGCVFVGCGKQLTAPQDSDMQRIEIVMDCLNMQLAAQRSYMNAVDLEINATEKGDTNMASYWHSNSITFNRMEHDAYQKLKSQ